MAASSASTSSESILTRAERFVSENKRALLVGAAATVAVAGAGYYLYTTRPRESTSTEGNAEKAQKKKNKKSSSKKKKSKDSDREGPILEEVAQKPEDKVTEIASGMPFVFNK
jgi:mitochondrial import receptor subunit TOM70